MKRNLEITDQEATTLIAVLEDAVADYEEAIPTYERYKGHAQGREECINEQADVIDIGRRLVKLFPELKS